MSSEVNESNVIVGYFDLYHGYPDSEILWISIFVVDKKYYVDSVSIIGLQKRLNE